MSDFFHSVILVMLVGVINSAAVDLLKIYLI